MYPRCMPPHRNADPLADGEAASTHGGTSGLARPQHRRQACSGAGNGGGGLTQGRACLSSAAGSPTD